MTLSGTVLLCFVDVDRRQVSAGNRYNCHLQDCCNVLFNSWTVQWVFPIVSCVYSCDCCHLYLTQRISTVMFYVFLQ